MASSSSSNVIEPKTSRVIEIESIQQYDDELSQVEPSQLVVVNINPSHMIPPLYKVFSQQFEDVKFLAVNADKFKGVPAFNDIKVPTFIFHKSSQKIHEIEATGGDLKEIKSAIMSYRDDNFESKANQEMESNLPGHKFPCFIDLMKNDIDTFLSASGILLRFADNILREPDNLRYRNIKLCNEIFMTKLLPVQGAVDCLFSMGFQEVVDKLFLDPATSLGDLKAIREALLDETAKRRRSKMKGSENKNEKLSDSKVQQAEGKSDGTVAQEKVLPKVKLTPQQKVVVARRVLNYVPILDTREKRMFYEKMISPINQIFLYENKELQKLARDVIPIEKLEQQAKRDCKVNVDNKDIAMTASSNERDLFLLGLLAWFKNDFFSWTNSPSCNKCGNDTKFHSNDIPNGEERIWDCGNVECYQCFNCYTITRFPRYNHPQKLLETRTGRCGEWANCFTLCCRAVGFEARYVLDWTDHVWTEVYSDYHKRWLHCDSCENVCDKPLLYENGWNKKLSYVIAFSKDQVIDVTWRYSLLHTDIVNRRKLVPEEWLFDFYMKATKEFQSEINDDERKSELTNRDIVEIVEFLTPRDKSKEEEQGRVSGSLDWRKARGEEGKGESSDDKKSYVFQATEKNITSKRMRILYFPAKDYYILNDSTVIHGWQNGVESSEHMFRKLENDWKMVYLARHEGVETGTIKWSINLQNTNLVISHVNVKIHSKLYETGDIDFKLFSEVNSIDFKDGTNVSSGDFLGSKSLHLIACLKGSTGNVAWQHAQLFRCSDTDEQFVGLEFNILFNEIA